MKFTNLVSEQIWKDRYCKNSETLDENFHRVAKYCSTNEKEEEDFYNVMNQGLFFPAGRTMSNAGIGRELTLNNCFLAGTKVITHRGLVNIEDIVVGDKVITHDGTWQNVNAVMCRDYNGDIYKISGTSLYDNIYCTPNHKFLTQHDWVRADRLLFDSKLVTVVDRLKTPDINNFYKEYTTVDLLHIIENTEIQRITILDNDKIVLEKKCNKNRHNNNINWMKVAKPINRYILFTPEFRYLIGRWIGDGNITKYRGKRNPSIIQIVFNAKKERTIALKCKEIGDKIFGIESTITETNQNIIAIRWCSEILATWFLQEFGEKCDGKKLNEKYIGDLEIAKGLFDADGFLSTHGNGKLVLKNYGLISWFKDTMYLNGYNTTSIKKVDRQKDTYVVSYVTNIGNKGFNNLLCKTYHDKVHNKITNNELYKNYITISNIEILESMICKVYNISVENNHSYTANGVVVHNCFVAPQIQDSLVDIFDKVKLGALTHQRGGGIGYDFSQLRPKGTPTSNDAIASGAISFMDCFNSQTATILQGNRRGANMGVMSVYHMDIEDFINAKSFDAGKLVHFNISVMVDDDFLNAVENNSDIYLHHPVYDKEGFILKDESKWKIKKKVSAKYIWDLIVKRAYETGEPGILNYSNMNNDNNLWYIENIVATNPCSEYLAGTLYGDNIKSNEYGGACNLGSLMLHNFIDEPFTISAKVDYVKLERTIYTAVRFLDNIIDINKYPDRIYENYQKSFRTIGLGITGLATMLTMLNLKYDSQQSRLFVFDLMNFIAHVAYSASINLATEKGEFPLLNREKFVNSGYITKHVDRYNEWGKIRDDILKHGIRNGKILSVAPTGTMSLTFGNNCSSGVEPIYMLESKRKVRIGGQSEENIQEVNLKDYGYDLWEQTDTLIHKDIFVTALEMSVKDHIDMLASVAWHVDMSVSKTINIPTNYSFEDTKEVYMKCFKAGIKGCTIFRPNELRQGIFNVSTKNQPIELPRGFIEEVPDGITYHKYKLKTGCGNLYFFVGIDEIEGKIYDCFTNTDGVGGCTINTQANSRLLSACLRGGVPIEYIIQQLEKSGTCPSYQYKRGKGEKLATGKSCSSAIANVLKNILKEIKNDEEENIEVKNIQANDNNINRCPECGEELRYENGCSICTCGYSHCG